DRRQPHRQLELNRVLVDGAVLQRLREEQAVAEVVRDVRIVRQVEGEDDVVRREFHAVVPVDAFPQVNRQRQTVFAELPVASQHRFVRGRNAVAGDQAFKDIKSEEHTSELQSRENLVCRLLLEKKKK